MAENKGVFNRIAGSIAKIVFTWQQTKDLVHVDAIHYTSQSDNLLLVLRVSLVLWLESCSREHRCHSAISKAIANLVDEILLQMCP